MHKEGREKVHTRETGLHFHLTKHFLSWRRVGGWSGFPCVFQQVSQLSVLISWSSRDRLQVPSSRFYAICIQAWSSRSCF